jgi:hypothetical protein
LQSQLAWRLDPIVGISIEPSAGTGGAGGGCETNAAEGMSKPSRPGGSIGGKLIMPIRLAGHDKIFLSFVSNGPSTFKSMNVFRTVYDAR